MLPLKAIQLLEKNLSDDAERVGIHLGKNEAFFTTANATIYTRLVEGKFPPYQQFIPKKLPVKFSVPPTCTVGVAGATVDVEAVSRRPAPRLS